MSDSGTALAEQQLREATFQATTAAEVSPALPIEKQLEYATGQPGAKTTTDVDAYLEHRAEEKRAKKNGHPMVQEKEAPAADPNKPDPRPTREDFKDDAEHTTAIAAWVVRQQNKIITAKPAEPAKVEEVQFDPNNRVHVELKQDFNGFVQAGRAFIESHPDFNTQLDAAAAKGLRLDNQAQREIMRRAAPEVLYYLAAPENEKEARAIMAMDTATQVLRVQKLASQKHLLGTPPTRQSASDSRSTGGHAEVRRDQMDTDAYIAMRREEKRRRFR